MKIKHFFIIIFLLNVITLISQENVKPNKLTENLYVSTRLWCNATFYVRDDGVYVFDCGASYSQGEMIMEQIKQVTDKPVKMLVYTHYHYDHVRGASALPKDIEIVAQKNLAINLKMEEESLVNSREVDLSAKIQALKEALKQVDKSDTMSISNLSDEIAKEEKELEELDKISIRYPTKLFEDTFKIALKDNNINIIFPGNTHTNDNCIIEFKNENAVYLGDILFTQAYPYVDLNADGDIKNWARVLKEYADKNYSFYIPGHNQMAKPEDLISLASYFNDMEQAVASEIKKGKSLQEIKDTMEKPEKYQHYGFDFLWPQNIEAFYEMIKDQQ